MPHRASASPRVFHNCVLVSNSHSSEPPKSVIPNFDFIFILIYFFARVSASRVFRVCLFYSCLGSLVGTVTSRLSEKFTLPPGIESRPRTCKVSAVNTAPWELLSLDSLQSTLFSYPYLFCSM
uniref:Uncharacterized protein n=1 Tax=Cacopsylla melanoneura TaxID=428564 RepID=A0A8D9EEM7_9HEMI